MAASCASYRDVDGLAEQRDLGRALHDAERVEEGVGAPDGHAGVRGPEVLDEAAAGAQRVGGAVVAAVDVGHHPEGAPPRHPVEHVAELVAVPEADAGPALQVGGVGRKAVIERAARVDGRLEEHLVGDPPAADAHHEHRVHPVVAGQVLEAGQLVEVGLVGHRLAGAEREQHAVAQVGGHRVPPRGVLGGRDLGSERAGGPPAGRRDRGR